MHETESIAYELASAFASGLTEAASMQAVVAERGMQSQTYGAGGRPARLGGRNGMPLLLARMRSAAGATDALCVEVAVTETGEYTVTYSGDVPSLPPRVVLDRAYRFPNHPLPGMARTEAAVTDGRPTDPAIVAEVRVLVDEFIREHTRLHGSAPVLGSGYTEAEILAAEARLGARLPEDLRALYRTVHDDSLESGLLAGYSLASLEKVVEWHRPDDSFEYGPNAGFSGLLDAGLFAYDPVVFETYPHGRVRRLSRNDRWVMFAPDYGMNYAAVDLDPAPGGAYGQVLKFGRDVHGPAQYIAPSVRHLVHAALAAMRTAQPGEEWTADRRPRPDHQWSVDLGAADLAAEVAAHHQPEAVQAVHLRQVDRVRLTDLAGFPNLRSIRMLDVRQVAEHVDLSIAAGQPVEQVHITARSFDPRLLASAPTVRYLTLGGNSDPVSVAALAELPELVRLDLADADVADIASVAGFPALRVLILDDRQWNELLATGRVPQQLTGAGLGGHTSVAQAAAWLTAVQGPDRPACGHRTIRGRL
ncbi:SMI1/KNR4 family protein [Catellatospora sp. KI3]|uniref:SMI1/KNR4 family protein n=1 Tax=Catellatospora sp. KI3 TaxID=3041620 RepID=UPI0024832DDD|nr:SMI1/KNR4 family protein [Catellatospora sp. KI3]MDI1462186.1 SMI1/KNR4 family protein [Catellatospora sp. KI3]